jgi:hypothetical protein
MRILVRARDESELTEIWADEPESKGYLTDLEVRLA